MLKPNTDYSVVLKTNQGDITIDLFEDKKPITVNNFVSLASKKFYDGIIFHRVIKDFMIQGGDPTGTGRGGPGYNFEDEFGQDDAPLVQGSLAMANAGPNTNGSQFFIVTAQSTPWLDGKHTNFGQVTKGLDVVLKIQGLATNAMDKPLEDVVIESVEIVETPKTATQ
ncbi:MAG: peptidylprolyl isomerase [Patescibacteria group bacterium]